MTLGEKQGRVVEEYATAKQSKRVGITQNRVLQEYARLVLFDPRNPFGDDGKPKEISTLDDDTAGNVDELEALSRQAGVGGPQRGENPPIAARQPP